MSCRNFYHSFKKCVSWNHWNQSRLMPWKHLLVEIMFRKTFANQLWIELYLPILLFFLCASFLELSGVLASLLGERGDWFFFNLPDGLQKKEGIAHSLDFSTQYQLFLSILVEAKIFQTDIIKARSGGGKGEGIVVDSLLVNNFFYI